MNFKTKCMLKEVEMIKRDLELADEEFRTMLVQRLVDIQKELDNEA